MKSILTSFLVITTLCCLTLGASAADKPVSKPSSQQQITKPDASGYTYSYSASSLIDENVVSVGRLVAPVVSKSQIGNTAMVSSPTGSLVTQ